jgi:hypothetical protein
MDLPGAALYRFWRVVPELTPTRLDADSSNVKAGNVKAGSVKAGSIQAGWYRAPGWPAAARQK